jgi:hypothetical protein
MPHAAATRSVATASHDIPRDASSDAPETLPFRLDDLVDQCRVRLKTGVSSVSQLKEFGGGVGGMSIASLRFSTTKM